MLVDDDDDDDDTVCKFYNHVTILENIRASSED